MTYFLADHAWVRAPDGESARLASRVRIGVGEDGRITSVESNVPPEVSSASDAPVHELGRIMLLPGFVNAHSHAFQRDLRGRTHVGRPGDRESFWSWREAMYALATTLDPDGVYDGALRCFSEMLGAGITCVGEFHYVHHRPDGSPYSSPNALSSAIIAAAADAGLRLALLEVYYARAGVDAHGNPVPPAPRQRRFCDAGVAGFFARVEALLDRRSDMLSIGVAPHSVRAVGRDDLRAIAAFADRHALPIHVHVSEQRRENEECAREHGCSPTRLLADVGALDRPRSFTAVHAIHVTPDDRALLGDQHVCACPSTEADLGDGIVPATELLEAGARLALGSDSNAWIDPVREAAALEGHERLRSGRRVCLATTGEDGLRHVTPVLMDALTRGGASSVGRPELGQLAVGHPFDAVAFDLDHVTLRDVDARHVLDALLLTGSAAAHAGTWVGGIRRC